MEGEYDAVVSVEMIEAVGYEYWAIYFQTIDRVLAPGGKVAIQAITMPTTGCWPRATPTPGCTSTSSPAGSCRRSGPSKGSRAAHHASACGSAWRMGDHYAATLRLWEERFLARSAEVEALGFDAVFQRMWLFYLCYSGPASRPATWTSSRLCWTGGGAALAPLAG